jgi:hypothetical protein
VGINLSHSGLLFVLKRKALQGHHVFFTLAQARPQSTESVTPPVCCLGSETVPDPS